MDIRIEKNFRHRISKAEKTPPFLFTVQLFKRQKRLISESAQNKGGMTDDDRYGFYPRSAVLRANALPRQQNDSQQRRGLLRRCSGGLNPRMEAPKRCKSEFFQNMAGAYFDQ
jgi:hypothetical protein